MAFFRFTWSLRQFNLVTIYVGAMPAPAQVGDKERRSVAGVIYRMDYNSRTLRAMRDGESRKD